MCIRDSQIGWDFKRSQCLKLFTFIRYYWGAGIYLGSFVCSGVLWVPQIAQVFISPIYCFGWICKFGFLCFSVFGLMVCLFQCQWVVDFRISQPNGKYSQCYHLKKTGRIMSIMKSSFSKNRTCLVSSLFWIIFAIYGVIPAPSHCRGTLNSGSEQVGSASALHLFALVKTLLLLLIPHQEFSNMRSGFVWCHLASVHQHSSLTALTRAALLHFPSFKCLPAKKSCPGAVLQLWQPAGGCHSCV